MSKSEKKTFMTYYRNDPEFRERHLKRMMEKVECPCSPGKTYAKCNMTKHCRTNVHKYWAEAQKLQKQLDEIQEILQKNKNYKYKK